MNRLDANLSCRSPRDRSARELEFAVARFEAPLRRAARRVAEGDMELAENLYQVATTGLWELDAPHYVPGDEYYLWRQLIGSMRRYYRNNVQRDVTRSRRWLR